MCGIAGLINLDGLDRASVEPRLAAALVRMAPRGPDGEGTRFDAHAALGHRRLAIIDLSPGATQPMTRGELALTYNGEIYNFAALRDELIALGENFASQSDTEVLLLGWRRWGRDLLPRLEGMFAFALWDAARRELVLARDRFGKKPLVYRHDGGRLAFASDLAALQELTSGWSLDHAALRLLFALRYIPAPFSILKEARKLPPGHSAMLTAKGLRIERWHTPRPTRPTYRDEAEAMADLRVRFDAAVVDRLVSDVPVGAFLSGGIDSALVCASLAAQGRRVKSFTVGFAGASGYYEERPEARRVAQHLGLEHSEVEVGAADALAALDAVFAGCDEPFADSSALPQYVLCREARRHVTVALSGDGADEVFGGYRKYQGELYAAWAPLARLLAPILAILPERKDRPLLELARRARRFLAHAGASPIRRQTGWMRQLSDDDLDRLLIDPGTAPTIDALIGPHRSLFPEDSLNAMLAADIGLVLPDDMLVKVDRMSMANGLEVRSPFLDSRVVDCALAMPGRFKLAAGEGKRILRRAFADRLPADVFKRPKKGFEMPIAQWLGGPLAERLRAAIDPQRLDRQGLFHAELPRRWSNDLASGRRDTAWPLWTMLAFQTWTETHGRTVILRET